jgi:transcriptional regulator with XRE-family HTH domain
MSDMGAPREAIALRTARERLGISQTEAARRAGMTAHTWCNYEVGSRTVSGVRIPSIAPAATLARLARAVQMDPDDLRRAHRADAAEAYQRLWPSGAHDGRPLILREAADVWDQLDGAGRTQLEQHLETLVEWARARMRREDVMRRESGGPRQFELFADQESVC